MADGRFVSYLRVSTHKQGAEGLGIEAQRKAVADFLNGGDWRLVAELVEVESGKRNDRPKLAEAIALCRAYGAKLVIAKLDRLSRDATFLLSLRDSGIEFVAADNPHASRLTVGILALVAEQEREAISARTKAALAAAKARGVRLGAFRDGAFVGNRGTAESVAKAQAGRLVKANEKAGNLRVVLDHLDPEGTMPLKTLADTFNRKGIPTPSGNGAWTATGIKRLRARLAATPDTGIRISADLAAQIARNRQEGGR